MKKKFVKTTFKFNISYLVLFFFMVFLVTSCQKDNITPDTANPEIQMRTQDKISKGDTPVRELGELPSDRGDLTYIDGSGSGDEAETRDPDIPCGSVTFEDSFFAIRYCLTVPGGFDISDEFCFSEDGLAESLADAGLTQTEINQILQDLFHSDTAPTPELVHTIGGLLAGDLDLPPNVIEDCYRSRVFVSGDFPGASGDDCAPGQIDNYALSQSLPAGGAIIGTPAANDVVIQNTCDGTSFDLDLTVDIMLNALVTSGMSASEANQQVSDIALGALTPREFLDLFQYTIVPNHPNLPNLSEEDLFCCYRISRVILSLLAANSEAATSYRVDGSANLGCITDPYEESVCFCVCEARDNYGDGEIYIEEIEVDCDGCGEQDCAELVPDWWDEYLENREECIFEVR